MSLGVHSSIPFAHEPARDLQRQRGRLHATADITPLKPPAKGMRGTRDLTRHKPLPPHLWSHLLGSDAAVIFAVHIALLQDVRHSVVGHVDG